MPDTSHNLFYWLHRNTSLEPETSPLIIWIQGETGMSSAQGLFAQHGPLQVSQKLNKTGVYQYIVAPADDGTTLTEIGDVLYLDQPVGTGFSYGANDTDLLDSMTDITREFVNFVDSFLAMYPEYKSPRKVILMGESSAGKFIPQFMKGLDEYI